MSKHNETLLFLYFLFVSQNLFISLPLKEMS